MRTVQPIRLSLSAEFVSHSAVFFSHNKSANSNFSHVISQIVLNLNRGDLGDDGTRDKGKR